MQLDRFPLADRMVVEMFGPLKSVCGTFRPHQTWALEGMIQMLWAFEAEEKRDWIQKVRAALHLLENGCNMYPKEMGSFIYTHLDQVGPCQMDIFGLTREVWDNDQSDEPDKRFRPILDLYVTLYEKFYPLLVAPLIVADAMLRTKVPIDKLINPNGRAKYEAIEDLETARHYPRGLLTDGLERHIRNSISHRHFQVMSREMIKMEDRDYRGKLTWGPINYLYYDLRDLVLKFRATCDALIATIIMFDVNNNEVLRERGFLDLKPRRMRLDIAQIHFRSFAETMGFSFVSVTEPDLSTLEVTLKISGWRHDSPSEILVGGGRRVRKFIENFRTEEAYVREQVYGLLQCSLDIHDAYEWVIVQVLRSDDSCAGIVRADRPARQIIFEGGRPIGEVRTLLAEDSLPEEKMPVVIREFPREV